MRPAERREADAASRWYVRWVDSCMKYEQLSPHELPAPVLIESVGFLLADTTDHITLCRDLHADGDARGVIAIPLCAIIERAALSVQLASTGADDAGRAGENGPEKEGQS